MKTIITSAAALAILATATAATAAGAGEFTVVNRNSQVSIQRVWTAQAGTNDTWNEGKLNAPIQPRSQSGFTLPSGSTCFYDVRIQFSDGVVQEFANASVCRGDRVLAD